MNVKNIKNIKGNKVVNQFILDDGKYTYFQSYDTIIARYKNTDPDIIHLDVNSWDYSRTTLKYLSQFLYDYLLHNVNKKIILEYIENGKYKLINLNK